MEVVVTELPYSPRPQFKPFHDRTQRWAALVCHRRAGKTVATLNDLIRAALSCDKPNARFAYMAPTYAQAKDVAWTYLQEFTAPIPGVEYNISELRVDLPNGARIRLYGGESYERLRGLYLDGIVVDEYGDIDPRAWSEVIRPALSDRRGWAVFIGTPKGRNHFCDLWEAAANDPAWFRHMLKASESGLLPSDELTDARKTMTAEQYEQEYECSFQAAVMGAYYGREMTEAEQGKRIANVPWEPDLQVHTAWDLGIGDSTAIWFAQTAGREVRVIDYLENSGVGLDWYARELSTRRYVYGDHFLPHDAEVKELGSGKSRVETLANLGISARVLPMQRLEDGINAARLILPVCWFDAEKCKRGIEALRMYRRDWDEKRKVFHDRPRHDWASHGADAFRYLAQGINRDGPSKPLRYDTKWVV